MMLQNNGAIDAAAVKKVLRLLKGQEGSIQALRSEKKKPPVQLPEILVATVFCTLF